MRLLDHPVIGSRYFFPRRTSLAGAVEVEVPGATLACHGRVEGEGPVLLHFHGNGEVVSDWVPDLGPALAALGVQPFFAEYRGYGASSGEPMLDTMLDDALVVADSLAVDPASLWVYGRSVGSLYALHVAANRKVAGLVLESGIADLAERLALRLHPSELGVSAQELVAAIDARFDQRAKIEAHAGAVLVLHTVHDHLVDVAHARRFKQWAGERARLVEFSHGDHNSIYAHNGAAILDEVARFVLA